MGVCCVSAGPVLVAGLSGQLRVFLDAIRALSAAYIVLHHLAIRGNPGVIEPLLRFGQEALMVFFLLSGFVIHANERHRATSNLPGYLRRRAIRIYPTLLAAMGVSMLVALADGRLAERFDAAEVLCTVFGLADIGYHKPGTICGPFMGNTPLWSLSYEIVFYAIYPIALALFLRAGRWSQHLLGAASAALVACYIAYPSHFLLLPAYFLLWWCGAMLAETHLNPRARLSDIGVPLGYLCLGAMLWAGSAVMQGGETLGTYPALMARHFTFAAGATVLALIGLRRWTGAGAGVPGAAAWAWLSSISYGVYVMHFPLLIQWSLAETWIGLALTLCLLIFCAVWLDRKINQRLRYLLRRTTVREITIAPDRHYSHQE